MKYLILSAFVLLTLSGCGGGGGGGNDTVTSASGGGTVVTTTPSNPTATPPVIPPVPIPSPTGIVFFRDDAVPGGTGTSSSPFNDLNQAIAAANSGEAVFLFAGSGNIIAFSGTVPANVQLVGEGVGFASGNFQVPAGQFPRLLGSLTLSDGSIVQGLQLENTTGNAVEASGTLGGILDGNRFTSIGGHAVSFQRVQGTVRISNNEFVDDSVQDPGEGVLLGLSQNDDLNLVFQGNTFTTPSRSASFDNGLHVVADGSSTLSLEASQNTFDNQGNGLNFQFSESADLVAQLTSNIFEGSLLEGISVLAGQSEADLVTSEVRVHQNTFSSNLGPAILLRARGTAGHTWNLNQNEIAAGGNFGVLCVRDDATQVDSTITNNIVSNALQTGIRYTSGTASGGFTVPLAGTDNMVLSGNQTTGSGVSGIDLNLISVTQAALLIGNTTGSQITTLLRGTSACFGAGGNSVAGPFPVTVEAGFNSTFDDRGQVSPAVTFPGAGAVTPGPCQP